MPISENNSAQNATLQMEVISAGAGSGKTYTLTQRMVDLLKQGVRPAGIMATTYTKKAAAELQERVRVKLLELGMTEAANELGEALIGTVHSIGTRLLQRFAFEAGVSPLVEIIADGDEQRLFNESLSQVLTESRIIRMNQLADRLGLTKKTNREILDWRQQIRELTDVARANNFDHKTLETSKIRSWETFERLLPPEEKTTPQQWNNRLSSAIDQAMAALDANENDTTKVTREAAETLRQIQQQLKNRGELFWYEWVKITKTTPGAKSRDCVEDLHELANRHTAHPQFREDIRSYIELVFDIAADALNEFERYKQKRGLIDYTDMETYVSKLLRVESVRETLRLDLDLLLVDEFQDTSPIQLDIFLQISQLAKHSIWVGDPKQSIYGFRGAEPALMHAIIRATGGVKDENILKTSWRSRPDIVFATNAIFERAFPDIPREQIVLEPAPNVHDNEKLALQHWHFRSDLDERRPPGSPWLERCIADHVRILLERKVLIFNKKTRKNTIIQPGDIAILCRSNFQCLKVADALHHMGLKAAISRTGLLETQEAKLALACLKYLLTPSDTLAAAEILLLTGSLSLEEMVEKRMDTLHHHPEASGYGGDWGKDLSVLDQLRALRGRTADLSASEILNLVLEELDLRRNTIPLGNPDQRLDNLDRLRRYALDYESACQRLHSAASLGGFLLWINQLYTQKQDTQGSGETDDAVKVLTYHRSKGLEFPVAICYALDQGLKEQIWGLNLVSERSEPDLTNILGHRWLRFWVNPYADLLKNTPLETVLHETPEWMEARKTALEEEARLLYVGITRARDFLVFPSTTKATGWLNRVFSQGDESIPTLDPNTQETPFYRDKMPLLIETEIAYKPKEFPERLPDISTLSYHGPRKGKFARSRANLNIDTRIELPKEGVNAHFNISEPQAWGHWFPFQEPYIPAIGQAVCTFMVADDTSMSTAFRLKMAQKQGQISGVSTLLKADSMLRQSEQLHDFIQEKCRPTRWFRKYAAELWQDGRLLQLEADYWLETPDGPVIVTFVPFAESMKKWKKWAENLQTTCAWWAYWWSQAKKTDCKQSIRFWIVFPLEGQMVSIHE